jgi:hypothetical protein
LFYPSSGGGPITVYYTIEFENGDTCRKEITIDCPVPPSDCCALVDFKLKTKWPKPSQQVGFFQITNLDPSSPICSIEITSTATLAGTLSTGWLTVDGISSSQPWTVTSIPATGTLTNPAINNISFTLNGTNYKGIITVCVVKCDGTRCCFEFKWNKTPLSDISVSIQRLDVGDNVTALQINPKVTKNINSSVKYVAFGFAEEEEALGSGNEFFAISATTHAGDEYPLGLTEPVAAYMGKFNAFFELAHPKGAFEDLGAFNLVFLKGIPKLAATLFDEEGNILFSGYIEIPGLVSSPIIQSGDGAMGMFEFINVFPNPSSDGIFTLTYATSDERDIEISVVNTAGKVMKRVAKRKEQPGIHKQKVDIKSLPTGVYMMVITSEGKVLSKSALKN